MTSLTYHIKLFIIFIIINIFQIIFYFMDNRIY